MAEQENRKIAEDFLAERSKYRETHGFGAGTEGAIEALTRLLDEAEGRGRVRGVVYGHNLVRQTVARAIDLEIDEDTDSKKTEEV